MVLFTNMQSVERNLYAISYRFNEQRSAKSATPSAFLDKQLDVTPRQSSLHRPANWLTCLDGCL